MRYSRHLSVLFVACALLVGNLMAQQHATPEAGSQEIRSAPTISFELSFPGSSPAYFTVSVGSTGKAVYQSSETVPNGNPADDAYSIGFTMSDAACQRVFALARQANYFKGSFEYTGNRVAYTGHKTLTYTEQSELAPGGASGGVRNSAKYNYSVDPAIQQLTKIFEGLSNTLELGRRLNHMRRFDKLGLDAELKRAEEMAKSRQLFDLQAIAPVLRQVANDYSVMRLARQRAEHLLSLVPDSVLPS